MLNGSSRLGQSPPGPAQGEQPLHARCRAPRRSRPGTPCTRAGGKRSKPASTGVWVVKRLPGSGGGERLLEVDAVVLHVAAGPLEDGEGGVALVEMADLGLDAQRAQHPPAADAEDDLLLQPHLGAAAVELAGDAPVGRRC